MTDATTVPQAGGTAPSAFSTWIQAIRAPSLSAAAIPVLLGMAVAARDGFFAPGRLVLALIGAMAIQAGTHLINDYYHFQNGPGPPQTPGPGMGIYPRLPTPQQPPPPRGPSFPLPPLPP